jgi:hypothetical protein
MALNAQIAFSVVAHESSVADISRAMRVTSASYAVALTDGSGAGQAQVAWSDSRTLGGSADSLNPAALSDTRDGASVTVALTAIKTVYVKNSHASNTLTVASSTLSSAGSISLEPGSCLSLSVVTAAGKTPATFTVSGASGTTYDIVLVGNGSVA